MRRPDDEPVTQPQLSVVIPIYNERYTVRELVRRVVAVDVSKEIVMVDDGSTDGTSEILKSIAVRYPEVRLFQQPRNQGKGAAIRRGIQESTGEFLIIQDADLEYDPSEYPMLLKPLLAGEADASMDRGSWRGTGGFTCSGTRLPTRGSRS